jgi:small subunit ribosomal protein S1
MDEKVSQGVQSQENLPPMMEGEEDFAKMLEESFNKKESGTFINGTIVEIKDDHALVDVGKKLEGKLNLSEITNEDGTLTHNVGDSIKVAISGFRSERPMVSHKKAIKKEKVAKFIEEHKEDFEELLVEAKVVGKNKGGLICEDSDSIEYFLPRSQALFKDFNQAMGKKIKARVLKIDEENESIIISRKNFLDEEKKRKKEIIDAILEQEEAIDGTIKKITTYGMFVDVGGVDGLVHYSEISYKGPVNPSTLFKEGEIVPVKAIKYDKEKRHLSLSIKAAMPDPWEEIRGELEVQDAIKVTVSNIEPYGVFVDLGNDIEGFLHISEISWDKNIKHPKEYLQVDDEIDVEVIEINIEEKRLRVSLKNILPKPFEEFCAKHKMGDVVTGTVTSVTNFGAFIKIDSVEGLLHNEDASWDRNEKCKDLYNEGDEIEVRIVKIDRESEKVSLSRKDILESPVQVYAKSHNVGDVVMGKVRDIKDFGIFVELDNGVDALIRKEDLGQINADELSILDDIEAVIANIDVKKNRIRLSIRRLAKMKERETLNEINSDDAKMTLGDLIKDQLQ